MQDLCFLKKTASTHRRELFIMANEVIKVNYFVVGMVQTNCYFLHRENSNEAIVFDPADLGDRLYEELQKRGMDVKAIFLTHAHFDHILGLEELRERTGAPVYACIHEKRLCEEKFTACLLDSFAQILYDNKVSCQSRTDALSAGGWEVAAGRRVPLPAVSVRIRCHLRSI